MEQISINNIGKKLSGIQMNTGAFGKISATDSFIIWIPETHFYVFVLFHMVRLMGIIVDKLKGSMILVVN